MATSPDTLINQARSAAKDYSSQAESLIQKANSVASQFQFLNWQDLKYNSNLDEPNYPVGLPVFDDFFNPTPSTAVAPTFLDLFLPDDPVTPDRITIDDSGLFKQVAPAYSISPFNKATPNLNIDQLQAEIDLIPTPDILDIQAPTLSKLTVRDAPTVTIPTFNASFNPDSTGDVPDIRKEFEDRYPDIKGQMLDFVFSNMNTWINQYAPDTHKNLSQLEDKLNIDMSSGKALSDDFEAALYTRSRDRAENESRGQRTEIEQTSKKRGFDLIPGQVTAGIQNSYQSNVDNLAIQSIEIAIERSRQEIQHVQFVMSLSQTVRQMLLGLSLDYARILLSTSEQALSYSKEIASILVNVYDLLIKKVNQQIAIYDIEAKVYETLVKSSLVQLDEIRLEIEIAKAKKDFEAVDVDLYGKLIEAENNKIRQLLFRLEAVEKKSALEKLKVDLFGEDVKAYVANISGKTAEYGLYESSVDADKAKLSGEGLRLDNYSKQVDAENNKQDLEINRMNATNDFNVNFIRQYDSELRNREIELKTEGLRFDSSEKVYRAALDGYKVNISTKLDTFRTKYNKAQLDLNASSAQYEGNIKISLENARNYLRHTEVQATSAQAAANTLGTMAASALGVQTTMISLSEQV